MREVYSTIATLDPAVVAQVADAMEVSAADPQHTGYGVYSSAVATGSLEHCLGVQFASLAPPTLRT